MVPSCKSQVYLLNLETSEADLWRVAGVPQDAKANPSKVSCPHPKPDCANQRRIGANLGVEERKLAEFYLAEAQRLAHMGNWAWQVAGRDPLHLSQEWYRIYGFDPGKGMPCWEERLQRVHPEDRGKWQGTIELQFVRGRITT